jgi:hypothetical protein
MYSVQGDTVLDPFLGTGTTSLAAISSGRNSVGFEKDSNFDNLIRKKILYSRDFNIIYTENRLASHEEFILRREQEGKVASHFSKIYGFPVITSQEVKISIPIVDTITETESGLFEVTHRMPSTKVQRSSELPKNIPKISHFYS